MTALQSPASLKGGIVTCAWCIVVIIVRLVRIAVIIVRFVRLVRVCYVRLTSISKRISYSVDNSTARISSAGNCIYALTRLT